MTQLPHPSFVQGDPISREDFYEVLDHIPSPVAFVSADEDLKVLYLNHAFIRTFGYQINDVQTVSSWTELAFLEDAIKQQRITSWLHAVDQAKKHQIPIPDRESHVRCKDNSHRDVIVQTSVLRNLLLLTFTDITEIKRLEINRLEGERRFRSFVENANDVIYTLNLDSIVTYLSPNFQKIFGIDPSEFLGQSFTSILHPDDHPLGSAAYAQVLAGHHLTNVEYRVRHGDGRWLWQSSNIGPIFDEQGNITAVVGVGRDIHLHKLAEEKLRLSEERYRLLSDNAQDVIWAIAPDGSITYVSPSVEQTRGYTPQEAMRQPLEQILTPESIALSVSYMSEVLTDIAAGRQPKTFRGEMEYLCKDGSTYWCDVMTTPILSKDGSLVELLGVSRDISEHKRYLNELKKAKESSEALNLTLGVANAQLNLMATTDTLTGLWNRRYLEERVSHEISMANRYGQAVSLLLFDIDHFKIVNDTFGHQAGDRVLVELTTLTRQHIRSTDLPCRWGGEEFMILMPNTGAQEAMAVAEKLRTTLATHQIPGIGTITASFGVATYLPNETLDNWITRTDIALYAAKNGGRNTIRLATG